MHFFKITKLKDIDPDDLMEMIIRVEASFAVKFEDEELARISKFGELCDLTKHKITLKDTGGCTSQQAFYKLRNSLVDVLGVDKHLITPSTPLSDLLPGNNRKASIQQLEQELGMKLPILRPPHVVTTLLSLLLLASFIQLFFVWQLGLAGLGLSIFGFWVSNQLGNELDVKTLGQLTQKITRENYRKSRRNPGTCNKQEIEKVLIDWFSHDLGVNKSHLTRDASFT
ncbi:MAG: hypothetical protein AAGI38_25045 [Bacteroidota bacterium]